MQTIADKARDVIVVILGGGRGTRLDPLTRLRSKPAVPIAAKYRLIDIPISNAINSGMERIYLLTQFNSVSLHRHVVETYKFDVFSRGFVSILAAQQTPDSEGWFQGTADAVRQNMRSISERHGDLVLILSGDHMYRMDYRRMLHDHLMNNADITIGALPCSTEEISEFGAMRVDGEGSVLEFREKPKDEAARSGMEVAPELLRRHGLDAGKPYLASMGIYIFNKRALEECLDNRLFDFGRDIIPQAVADGRRVQAHFYDGYWRDIGTIRAFFDTHLELVQDNPPFEFNDVAWPFYTRPRYLPGARIIDTRFDRSILADGSVIEGSVIEESIIGVRAIVRKAQLKRVLSMGIDPRPPQGAPGEPALGIGEGTVIENAIIDKNARIGRNCVIRNVNNLKEADGPCWAIREGLVIIPKNTAVPDGTVI